MLSKINPSAVVAQCWYLRRHVPEGRRWREDGALHGTCRYCGRAIRSRGHGRWDLAEGFDLDGIGEGAQASHFCVVDTVDGIVIARYPVPAEIDEGSIAMRLAEIGEAHGVDAAGGALEVRLVQNRRPMSRPS